eukprot:6203473-Pleurochrysis_carterae.AAC.4
MASNDMLSSNSLCDEFRMFTNQLARASYCHMPFYACKRNLNASNDMLSIFYGLVLWQAY